jgi:SAM-dependent methyltransferase
MTSKQPQIDKWPKTLPVLTKEQQTIRDDFMREHLKAVQTKWYGFVERFNHGFPRKTFFTGCKTLEIGAGLGAHLHWEDYRSQQYHVIELRQNLCDHLMASFPGVEARVGDCQKTLPYDDEFFDRVLAIHVLEHLPNLPAALREIFRVLKKDGVFSIVIPCEGSLATRMARNISARPHFEKKYKQSYDWFIACEHINLPHEILEEIEPLFSVVRRRFYPLPIPIINLNLFIGMDLRKK